MLDRTQLRRQEYTARINRVMDYVRENLSGDLRLETLASVASFSPFHFHRLFKSLVGETVHEYVRRQRCSAAAAKLIYNPKLTITEISTQCGFGSPSSFAREFRAAFGTSASQFRAGSQRRIEEVRTREENATSWEEARPRPARTEMSIRYDVREMPVRRVAYIRHTGAYNRIGEAFERLMRWAGPRGLTRFPGTEILAIYHDSPDLTPEAKLRSDACITVPEETTVDGEVCAMDVPGGLFVVTHVEIDPSQYGEAWDRLLSDWLPESGYQPDDRMCFERYLNDPKTHPRGLHIVEICEPIRPL
ncbi:MAG: AraC family transcriptional regulator [Candidatus Bipolaricaulota bacterium]|nr:MAG: AraC family transcriptional regulator [Candidatus Bipolaricaulota bacterium]